MKSGISACKRCGLKFKWYKSSGIPAIWCSKECQTFLKNLNEKEKLLGLINEFDKKVIRLNGCWDWKGLRTSDGYSRMSCSTKYGTDKGHIASYIIHKGIIKKGLQVRHLCHNRICTNPDHLEIGTAKQNALDSIKDGRTLKGYNHHNSILNEMQIKEIKNLLNRKIKNRIIAKMYNVSDLMISRIKNGITYKD